MTELCNNISKTENIGLLVACDDILCCMSDIVLKEKGMDTSPTPAIVMMVLGVGTPAGEEEDTEDREERFRRMTTETDTPTLSPRGHNPG